MRDKQKGFATFEMLLTICMVGLVLFVGWYLWNGKRTSDASSLDSSSTVKAVSSAQSAYTTYNKVLLEFQYKITSSPREVAGLKAIQNKLSPALYLKLNNFYAEPQPEGRNNDIIVCSFGQFGYFDAPIKAHLKATDAKTAVVEILSPADMYYDGKHHYDYSTPGVLYTVDLASMKVTDIRCEQATPS